MSERKTAAIKYCAPRLKSETVIIISHVTERNGANNRKASLSKPLWGYTKCLTPGQIHFLQLKISVNMIYIPPTTFDTNRRRGSMNYSQQSAIHGEFDHQNDLN